MNWRAVLHEFVLARKPVKGTVKWGRQHWYIEHNLFFENLNKCAETNGGRANTLN